MKASIRLAMTFTLALAAAGLAGCNDSGIVAAPASTPTPEPTATPANPQAPVAIIDNNSPIYDTLDTAEFEGWYSYDPDGYIASYHWDVTVKPSGSTATMVPDGFDGSTSQLYIDMPGDYTISLTVTDDSGLTDTTTASFSATISQMHVQLTWLEYGDADLDLHLINMTATTPAPALWDNSYDCHWRNCKPSSNEYLDWGVAGETADNPRLDVDNIISNVPENMNIEFPQNGSTYEIAVHYYGSSSGGPMHPTINVFFGGTLVMTTSATLANIDDVWTVADIAWANSMGSITMVGTMGHTNGPNVP